MWSQWSHVAVVFGEYVIDATFKHGVARRKLDELLATCSYYQFRDEACPDLPAAYAFARSQIGKPYDLLGVLGIGLHRNWQEDDSWFCSELKEAIQAAGGNPRFGSFVGRVTPQHSWMVNPDLLIARPGVH